jgi:hypothetical protein
MGASVCDALVDLTVGPAVLRTMTLVAMTLVASIRR